MKYSPVRVKNPNSNAYVVKLFPNQDLEIVFSSYLGHVEIDVETSLLQLLGQDVVHDPSSPDEKAIRFHISQTYDLTSWSNISRTHLGNITVMNKNNMVNICVYLECLDVEKNNVITAVNPGSSLIRIEPQQILEVVLYDSTLEPDKWTCNIIGGNELALEQILYKKYSPYEFSLSKEKSDIFAAHQRTLSVISRQHHFWFRCSVQTIELLSSKSEGLFNVGKLAFFGQDSQGRRHNCGNVLSVLLNLKRKHKDKIFSGLLCSPPKSNNNYPPINVPIYKKAKQNTSKSWSYYARPQKPRCKKVNLTKIKNATFSSDTFSCIYKKNELFFNASNQESKTILASGEQDVADYYGHRNFDANIFD